MRLKSLVDKFDVLVKVCRMLKQTTTSLVNVNNMLKKKVEKVEQEIPKIENELERVHKMFENLLTETYETKEAINKLVVVTQELSKEQKRLRKEHEEFENRVADIKHNAFMKGAMTWGQFTTK